MNETDPRSWTRHLPFLMPLTLGSILAADTPMLQEWDGTNSATRLPYEEALEVVFDPSRPWESQHTALCHLMVSIKRGIRAIKKCVAEVPELGPAAMKAFIRIDAMLANPTVAPVSIRRGQYYAVLDSLKRGRLGEFEEQRRAIAEFIRLSQAGIEVLNRAATIDRRFALSVGIQSPRIVKRLGSRGRSE